MQKIDHVELGDLVDTISHWGCMTREPEDPEIYAAGLKFLALAERALSVRFARNQISEIAEMIGRYAQLEQYVKVDHNAVSYLQGQYDALIEVLQEPYDTLMQWFRREAEVIPLKTT